MDPIAFPEFQPESPDFYLGDPASVFARLRDEDPVHWYEGASRFWCVTRHADVREVSRRPRRFSSAEGILINQIGRIQQGETPPPTRWRPWRRRPSSSWTRHSTTSTASS